MTKEVYMKKHGRHKVCSACRRFNRH